MTSELIAGFLETKASTQCPFARDAAVAIGSKCTAASAGVELGAVPAELTTFLERFRTERISGFVFAVSGPGSETLTGTTVLFARTLAALTEADPSAPRTSWRFISTTYWQFSFAGEPLFLNVFSECYPPDHSKHLKTGRGIVVFAQPDDTFEFCGVDPSRRALKNEIRRRFAEAGRPYDGAMIDRRIEADLYVFPMRVGDPPVRWWHEAPIEHLMRG